MFIGWPLAKAFLAANWKPIAAVLAVLGLIGWHKVQINAAWRDGRNALIAEQAEEAKRRNADAQAADDASRKCSSDPACRLQDDGFRRD